MSLSWALGKGRAVGRAVRARSGSFLVPSRGLDPYRPESIGKVWTNWSD